MTWRWARERSARSHPTRPRSLCARAVCALLRAAGRCFFCFFVAPGSSPAPPSMARAAARRDSGGGASHVILVRACPLARKPTRRWVVVGGDGAPRGPPDQVRAAALRAAARGLEPRALRSAQRDALADRVAAEAALAAPPGDARRDSQPVARRPRRRHQQSVPAGAGMAGPARRHARHARWHAHAGAHAWHAHAEHAHAWHARWHARWHAHAWGRWTQRLDLRAGADAGGAADGAGGEAATSGA